MTGARQTTGLPHVLILGAGFAGIYAAKALVPGWIERGGGYFLTTASAAGMLTQIGSAPYAVTKHAAVAFAEWLSVSYGDHGIRASALCPMGVNTNMLNAGAGDTPNYTWNDALYLSATPTFNSASLTIHLPS